MPLVSSPIRGDVLAVGDDVEQETEKPELAETIGAAFRRENTLAITPAPTNTVDGYDPFADIEGYEPYAFAFVRDDSPEKVAWRKKKIDQEIADRETLDAAGWTGVAASVAAGILDPITLPFLAAKGIKAGKPLVSAGRLALAGAAGTAASEAVLQVEQDTRSPLESLFAITAGTLVSGAIGGAVGALTKGEAKVLEEAVSRDFRQVTGSVGAAARNTASSELDGFGNALGKVSPLGYNMTSRSSRAKELSMGLAENGFFLRGNAEGQASQQAVETLIKRHEATRARAVHNTNALYSEYRTGVAKDSAAQRVGFAVTDPFKTDKPMGFREFRDEIGKAMRRGDRHEIPQVQAAAKFYRENVFDPLKKQMVELELLDDVDEVVGAESYLSRVYNVQKLRESPQPFKDELARYFMEQDETLELAEALDIANTSVNRILGTAEGIIPLNIVSKPGVSKARVLTIDDSRIEDYLVSDIDQVADHYVRTVAPRVEIAKRYGSLDLETEISSVADEYDALIDANPKLAGELGKERDRVVRNLRGMRDRLLGTFGAPADPTSFAVRSGRVLRESNFLSMLGGMTVSALPDVARPAMVVGYRPYIKAFSQLASTPKAFRGAMKELRAMGAGLDMINSSRIRAIAGTDDFPPNTRFERGLQRAANNFGKISLMSPWNAFWKQFTGVMSSHNLLEQSARWSAGKAGKAQIRQMASLGIDENLAGRIAKQFDDFGDKGDVWLANVDEWTDREAAEAFEAAILRQVDTAIITPGVGDLPLFASTELGKLLTQFKSFAFAAQNRMLLSTLQQNDLQAYSGLLLTMALGALTYGIKTSLAGREVDTSPGNLIAEAMDRSGFLGVLSEGAGIAEKASGGLVGIKPLIGAMTGEELEPMSRFVSRNAIGALLGPSFGKAQDALTVTSAAGRGEFSESDLHAMRKMMPYQNLFWLRQYLNEVEQSIADNL